MYNRDLAGTRHSPLTQINTDNVANLTRQWSFALGADPSAGGLSGGSQFTPLVIDDTMYLVATNRVVALEPETGELKWEYLKDGIPPSRRGMAYWDGPAGEPARVFVTAGRELIALGAATGEEITAFGNDGRIDINQPYNGAPTVFGNLIILGTNAPPGGVRAFDVRTGEALWDFHSVPEPGEPGSETWEPTDLADRSGTYHWAFSMTLDAERSTLYAVFETPGPIDYWGGDRVGDNLFGNSVVALDALSGELDWYFQTVHHDLWDYDIPSPPGLLDVTIEGETVPILAIAAKTGYMYLLNRITGEPIYGIDEVPVPQSDVPEEQASPTQPVPIKPPPIARVRFAPEDIVTAADTTAEHAAFCRDLVERSGGFVNQGPFTPYVYRAEGAPPRSTVIFPGSVGGANWGGTASDPDLGYIFVNTMDEASFGWIEPSPEGARVPYRRNSIVGSTSRFQWHNNSPDSFGNINGAGEDAWPCQKPPWGRLVAVDASTGDIAWQVPLGITEALPEEKQRTGTLNFGGPITTAGGLVFIGATNDRRFRAFDSRTGEELWVGELEMSAHAVPITYQGRDQKQYVAISAGGSRCDIDDPGPEGTEALVVFSLP
jgi:quinoprotein glucose dehydrogenase